jgi:hypothetical protein
MNHQSTHAPNYIVISSFYGFQKAAVEMCLIEEFRLNYWPDYFCHFRYPDRNGFDLYVRENHDSAAIRERLYELESRGKLRV